MASFPSPTDHGIPIEEENESDYQNMRLPWNGRRRVKHDSISSMESFSSTDSHLADSPTSKSSSLHSTRKQTGRRRGRKPSKIDLEAKLERSRQSARECRARKKLRYKCLEDTVATKESDITKLKEELNMYVHWCKGMDQNIYPTGLIEFIKQEGETAE